MDIHEEKKGISDILQDVSQDQELICANLERTAQADYRMVLFGKTSVGKTTLSNFLCDNSLKVTQGGHFNELRLEGTGVGHQRTATTTVPNFFFSKKTPHLAILDCPGTSDTRGQQAQIKNSIYIKTIFSGLGHVQGLSNFHLFVVIEEGFLRSNGSLAINDTMSDVVDLIGQHRNVLGHLNLIITKCDPEVDSSQHKGVLSDLSSLYIHRANSNARAWETCFGRSILAHFADLQKENILYFHKPTNTLKFESMIKKDLMSLIETTDPLSHLESHIVISGDVRSNILTMGSMRKEQVLEEEKAVIADLQNALKYEFDAVTHEVNNPNFEYETYLDKCGKIKTLLHHSIEPQLSEKPSKQQDYNLLEVFGNMPTQLKGVVVYQNQQRIKTIRACLDQLECFSSIGVQFRSMIHDGLKVCVNGLKIFISEREKEMLKVGFEQVNTSFNERLIQFKHQMTSNIERSSQAFDQLSIPYQAFKAVQQHLQANKYLSDPVQAFKRFIQLVNQDLTKATESFPKDLIDDQQNQEKLSDLKSEMTKLFKLHENYTDLLLGTPYNNYLELFRSMLKDIVEEFEKQVTFFVKEHIKEIDNIVQKASSEIDSVYLSKSKASETTMIESIVFLEKIFKFFEECAKQRNGAEQYNQSIREALEEKGELENIGDKQERLNETAGLKDMIFAYKTLDKLNKEFIQLEELSSRISNMAKKINQILVLIRNDDIPVKIMNMEEVGRIVNVLLKHKKRSYEEYSDLVVRHEQAIAQTISHSHSLFSTQCNTIGSHEAIAPKVVEALSGLENEEKLSIDTLRVLHESISDDSVINQMKEPLSHIIERYEGFEQFITNHNKPFNDEQVCEHIFDKIVEDTQVLYKGLKEQSVSYAKTCLNTMEEKLDVFWQSVDAYGGEHPRAVAYFLGKIDKQNSGILGPWQIQDMVYSCCYKRGLHHMDITGFNQACNLYDAYSKLFNPLVFYELEEPVENLIQKFWGNFQRRRDQYDEPNCCCRCWTHSCSFWYRFNRPSYEDYVAQQKQHIADYSMHQRFR